MLEETSTTVTAVTPTPTTAVSDNNNDELETVSFDVSELKKEGEEGPRAGLKEESIEGLLANVYEVTLSDPMKITGTTSGYVTYSVNVRRVKDGKCYSTRKRYNDFLFLQDALRRQHPSCVVPSMPEKSVGDKFAPGLIKERLEGLGLFLQRVVAHPTLVKDEVLEIFLTGTEPEFAARVRSGLPPAVVPSTTEEAGGSSSSSMFGSFLSSVGQGLSSFGINIGTTREEETDPWFAKQEVRLERLEKALSKLLLSSYNLANEWRDLASIEARGAAGFLNLSRILADDEPSAKSRATSDSLSRHTRLALEMADIVEHNFHECIKEYIKEIASIKVVLDKRQEYLRAFNTAVKNCKSNSRMSVAVRDVAKEDLECFSKEARADIERTYKIRKVELLRAVTSFASVAGVCAGRYARVWASSAAFSKDFAGLAKDNDEKDDENEEEVNN